MGKFWVSAQILRNQLFAARGSSHSIRLEGVDRRSNMRRKGQITSDVDGGDPLKPGLLWSVRARSSYR
jgi:hypothetical protein